MKSPALFKEYIWLVNVIYQAKRISLEEINRKWKETDMSGGLEMSRSTFNRHKDAIEDMFGIYIECERTAGYKYYIGNAEVLEEDTIQNWMLATLSVNNIISESRSVHDRIILESIPSEGESLQKVIDAMKRNVLINVTYRKYSSSSDKELVVEPYCVKLYHRRWYVLCRYEETKEFVTLSFDRIESMTVTDKKFEIDADFKADQFFVNNFGIVSGDGTALEKVVVRAFGTEKYYLRDLPIHHSQKEIATKNDYSDFEYHLCPTLDFAGYVVSRAARLKVLEPLWLAKKIRQMHEESMKLYD
jgi:hypothetical protein